ncbi:MAG: NUDIX hydrolase [Methylobacteriaceae bacterium]|nr:NUDIX hydrolase [Methylobacteriaceae bacterium]
MSADLRIEAVDAIDIHVEQYDWPFARARARDIDAHWRKLRAARPHLFNGRVFLFRNLQIAEAHLTGSCFEVDFKVFIAARDFGHPDKTVFNCFAQGALRALDGAFLLGEMAAHTSNAGRIYFPAGTPDTSDAVDGRVDLDLSVMRELTEETGLRPDDIAPAPGWTVVFDHQMVACLKPMRLKLDRAAALAQIAAHISSEEHPELARIHVASSRGDIVAARMPLFIQAYLNRELA